MLASALRIPRCRRSRMDIWPTEFMTDGRYRPRGDAPNVWSSRTDRRSSRLSTGGASTLRRDAGRRRSRQTCLNGGPSSILPLSASTQATSRAARGLPVERSAALRALSALVPQEPLDVGDEVVAGRQPLLVVHRLEALDVAPRRVVRRSGRIEALPKLPRLIGQLAGRYVDVEMA